MDMELMQYLSSACILADRYLEMMENFCEQNRRKLPVEFAQYRALRKKHGEMNNG